VLVGDGVGVRVWPSVLVGDGVGGGVWPSVLVGVGVGEEVWPLVLLGDGVGKVLDVESEAQNGSSPGGAPQDEAQHVCRSPLALKHMFGRLRSGQLMGPAR
jgi:hypothetical protein